MGVIGNNDPRIQPVDAAIDLAHEILTAAGVPVATKSLGYFSPYDFQVAVRMEAKLTALKAEGVDVLYVCSDPVATSYLRDLIQMAHRQPFRMRTMHEIKEARGHGGNQTYGASFEDLFSKAAEKVDQILRGTASPGNIEVWVPRAFEQDPA